MLCRYARYALCSAQVRSPTSGSPAAPGWATPPLQSSWLVRPMPAESLRYADGTLAVRLSRYLSNDEDTESSSGWFVPLISQYSNCTLRFHQVPGHGVFSSHGPQGPST